MRPTGWTVRDFARLFGILLVVALAASVAVPTASNTLGISFDSDLYRILGFTVVAVTMSAVVMWTVYRSENWKAYLRPNVAKLVIGVMLFGLLSAFPASFCVEGGTNLGSPFIFYSQCSNPGPGFNFVPGEVRFNALALTVDLLLWYVVAATLVTLFGMGRKRRERI
jgi:O-antigen/teichoic acid export membrane protein